MQRHVWSTILLSTVVGAAPAHADQEAAPGEPAAREPRPPKRGFIEGYGNWGFNLGRTDYVPDGLPGESKHPLANGFGVGATAGVTVVSDWLSIIADYRYGRTSTREGDIMGVLDKAEGKLTFHAITAGVRIDNRLGAGSVYAQLHAGIVLPFETRLELEYAPELAAVGIMGEGRREEEFGIAIGAQAELGYHVELPQRLYLGAGLRLAAFQGNNAGKETSFTNFVNFSDEQPMPVTTTIHHGTNAPVTPTTYSIQDVRLNVSIGYMF